MWSGMVAPHNGKLRMTEQLIRRTAHRLAALARGQETTGERVYCMEASQSKGKDATGNRDAEHLGAGVERKVAVPAAQA